MVLVPAEIVAGLDAIRTELDRSDLPPDGPTRNLPELTSEVARAVRLRLTSHYADLAGCLPDLLAELHRAYATGQHKTVVAALLVQAYRAADALADKFSQHDLSARIITLMMDAARQSDDQLAVATTAYVRGELFFAGSAPEAGAALLERAANTLTPVASVPAWAAYGALHMRAAVLAGLARHGEHARDHMAEAREYAARVPDGQYNGTAFGPSSVRIHEVTLAIDTGDPDTALKTAEQWEPPADLPGERQSHFYIDLARAHAQVGATEQTMVALVKARTVASEHTRSHPLVRQVVNALRTTSPSTQGLADYAQWARIDLRG